MSLKAYIKGFTLTEILMAQAIAGMVLSGILIGFGQSATRSEWSAYSLAANNLAMQKLEQARAAKWDPMAYPSVDDLTNMPPQIAILDIPIKGTNYTFATNFTTVKHISVNPPVKMVKVDCAWTFNFRGKPKVFTNTVAFLRAPDQ